MAAAHSIIDAVLQDSVESASPPRESGALPLDSPARVAGWVDVYFEPVWRFLRRLGVDGGAVDDAAQEVFEVAARRAGDVRPGAEKSFLFSTALRVAKSARRKQASRSARLESLDDEAPASGGDPEQLLSERRALELLDKILDSLGEPYRTTFVLFELEGFTFSEIAEIMAVPRGTVASRMRRARADFLRSARRLRAAFTPPGEADG